MFVIDDIILRMLGIQLPVPFDMLTIFEYIRDFALKEKYNPEKIKDQLKENRMLYEMGEISEEEYKKRDAELKHKLKIADRVKDIDLNTRMDILGVGG